MSIHIAETSDEQIASLVAEINTKGFGSLPNYIAPDDLKRMQGFVDNAIEKSNHEYVGFNGPAAVSGSGLEELAASPVFQNLIKRVYERGTGQKPPEQEFYQVLRCLSGETGQKNSLIFHYDSYVVTALIPIRIPDSGQPGDLVMLPNLRNVRKAYLFNAIDKVLLDNPVTQAVLRKTSAAGKLPLTHVKMTPGNIYFFWGYRSVHTNQPCDPDKVRATALFHYANPHRDQAA